MQQLSQGSVELRVIGIVSQRVDVLVSRPTVDRFRRGEFCVVNVDDRRVRFAKCVLLLECLSVNVFGQLKALPIGLRQTDQLF